MTKKYNYNAKHITCPLCGATDIGVRPTGRIREHMPGRKGLAVTRTSIKTRWSDKARGRERCAASGKTEAELGVGLSEHEATLEKQWQETKQLLETLKRHAVNRSAYEQQIVLIIDAIIKELDDVRERLRYLEQQRGQKDED